MRKWIAAICLILFIFNIAVVPSAAVTSKSYPDSKTAEILQAARNHHLAEDLFLHDLDQKITRQELAMLMVTLLEKLSYKGINQAAKVMQVFYDYKDKPVPPAAYIPYIYLASKLGVVESVSKNRYDPYGLVNRGAFASALLKAILLAKPFQSITIKNDIKFSDDGKIIDSTRPGLLYAYKNKYLDATPKNEINPRGYVTRIQALDILYRVLVNEKVLTKLSSQEVKRATGELPLYPIRQSSKWGYADASGVLLIPAQYENARNFSNGLAAVSLNGKWGYVDTAGNLVVNPEYDQAHDLSAGMAAVSKGTQFGYLDNTGKLAIPLQYLCDKEFSSNLSDFCSSGCAIVKTEASLYKVIDTSGKILSKQKILAARSFSDGLAAIKTVTGPGFMDTKGKLAFKLDSAVTEYKDFHEGLAAVLIKGKYGYISKTGKLVIQPQYLSASDFKNGQANVRDFHYSAYVIDKKGKVIR